MIKIAYKQVGKEIKIKEIPNELSEFQKLVNGCIEFIPFPIDSPKFNKFALIVNEEGKIDNLKKNISYGKYDYIAGDFVVVKEEYFEQISLDDKDFELIKSELEKL